MEWERIRKQPEERFGAGLPNYEEYVSAFSWTQARAMLDGLPGGGLNIAHEAVDRHLRAGRGDKLALRWIGRDDRVRDSAIPRWARQPTGLPTSPGPARSHQGRQGLFAARQDTGTLLRGSRHPEERKRIFTPVLGVRARTDQSPHVDRQCQSPRHIRSVLPPQDRALAQRASQPGANLPDRFLAHSPARHDRPSSRDGSGIGSRRDGLDRARRHGVVALHQRHDRTSEGGRAGTCTRPSWHIISPAASHSTSDRMTSSGALPIRDGLPAPPTASSRH